MGFFDLFKARDKKPGANTPAPTTPKSTPASPAPTPAAPAAPAASATPDPDALASFMKTVKPQLPKREPSPAADPRPRLAEALSALQRKDLPMAVTIYEKLIEEFGARGDVLAILSRDLGQHGQFPTIIELLAPHYEIGRHGPIPGFNLLQAYLGVGDVDSARHVLGLIQGLNHPDLERPVAEFTRILNEMEVRRHEQTKAAHYEAGAQGGRTPEQEQGEETPADEQAAQPRPPAPSAPATPRMSSTEVQPQEGAAPAEKPAPLHINMVTISKPIWFYGLEDKAAKILPPKTSSKLRRIAFTQLALPGEPRIGEILGGPEEDLGRLTRSIPLFLHELFYYSPQYLPISVLGLLTDPTNGESRLAAFAVDWTDENVSQLTESTKEIGLDYIFMGSLRRREQGGYELLLRLWDVKRQKERKQFVAAFTDDTLHEELSKLVEALGLFMEYASYEEGQGIAYSIPADLAGWLNTIGASAGLFLYEKKALSQPGLHLLPRDLQVASVQAKEGLVQSLAWISLTRRAIGLGLIVASEPPALVEDPLVKEILG